MVHHPALLVSITLPASRGNSLLLVSCTWLMTPLKHTPIALAGLAPRDFEAIGPRRTLRHLEQAATLLLSEVPELELGDWCSRQ